MLNKHDSTIGGVNLLINVQDLTKATNVLVSATAWCVMKPRAIRWPGKRVACRSKTEHSIALSEYFTDGLRVKLSKKK